MGIYYKDVRIIGRSSGRSATGAAAYRSGEALRSAAYRSGGELDNGVITHDYRNKGGVVYSEIILPEGAPKEFGNRQTLWNFVDSSEKRKDAQLAREIIVALQREFELQEQLEILREYIRENFVEKGMIADFSVHDNKKNDNPHAHIMLTLRDVTSDGFGKKNREWNRNANLMEWRKSWAAVNNRMFERKGLAERIDHRSYKDQGIDREPQIHLGHEAWALEKKGIKTDKGDYNREVQKRNNERAVKTQEQKSDDPQEVDASDAATNSTPSSKPQALKKEGDAERAALMSAKRNLREIEEHLKSEKAAQIVGKLQEEREVRREAEKTARHMNVLNDNYVELDKELSAILRGIEVSKQENWQLGFLADHIVDEHVKNLDIMRGTASKLQMERQKMSFWDGKRKKEIDIEIEKVLGNIRVAQHNFKKEYGFDLDQAPAEIKRIREKIRENKDALNKNTARILEIKERQAAIELEYRTRKLLNELRPDREQIEKSLEKMNNLNSPAEGVASGVRSQTFDSARHHAAKSPESVRERLRQNEITRRLNTITKETFQKIIEKLPEPQAQTLIKLREEKETELLKQATKDRAISIERDR